MDDAASIEAEIAALEEKREALLARRAEATSKATSRAEQGPAVLAGASPSPAKKKRKLDLFHGTTAAPKRLFGSAKPGPSSAPLESSQRLAAKHELAESSLVGGIDATRQRLRDADARRGVVRSTAFTATAPKVSSGNDKGKGRANIHVDDDPAEQEDESEYKAIGNERDDDLALIHRLEPGPRTFEPLVGDPDWNRVEPNSGIRLKSRVLEHETLQEHLSDRFHIPPELLYSLVRPSKGGTEYELPIEGDWIVIGVLADKSEIRMTGQSNAQIQSEKAKAALRARQKKERERADRRKRIEQGKTLPGDLETFEMEQAQSDEELKEADDENAENQIQDKSKTQQRRYMSFKLVDLKHRNAGGGQGILNLRLFESDPSKTSQKQEESSDDEMVTSTGIRVKKEKERNERGNKLKRTNREYKGGSGGAYEKFWKEREGTVVAILNPRIMKPWQGTAYNQGANANILSLTPESADSMIIIGRAQDLGSCQARKKDGKLCGSWCDTRVADACEWHVQQAVKNRRAGRAEFFAGTGGMQTAVLATDMAAMIRKGFPNISNATKSTKSTPFDPATKTGLLPEKGSKSYDGLKTYIVGQGQGTSSSGGSSFGRKILSGGGISSKGLARPGSGTRFASAPSNEMSRDSSSSLNPKERAQKRAREEVEMREMLRRDGGKSLGAKYLVRNGKATKPAAATSAVSESAENSEDEDGAEKTTKKRVFDIQAVRRIGWDPSSLGEASGSGKKQKKLDALKLLGDPARAAPKLGPRPGKKVRSGVSIPTSLREADSIAATDDWDDLEVEGEEGNGSRRQSGPKTGGGQNAKHDSGFMFSSDEEMGEDDYLNHESDSDLEIEAPVTIEME